MTVILIILLIICAVCIIAALLCFSLARNALRGSSRIMERYNDYRRASEDTTARYVLSARPGGAWEVSRVSKTSTAPVFTVVKVFDDEDESYNMREAEELLSALRG